MTEDDRQPLSEEAALRQLEELHREIERTRLRRKDANDAFDRFLRSFDRSIAPQPVAEPERRRPPMPAPPAEMGRPAPPSRPVAPPAPPAQLPPAPPFPPALPPPTERVFGPPPAPEPVLAPPPPAEPVFAAPTPPESSHEDEIVTLLSPDPTDRLPESQSGEAVPLAVHSAEPPPPLDLRALEAARPRSTDESLSLDEWEEQAEPRVTTGAFPAEADIATLGARRPAAPGEARPVPVALTVPVARAGPRIPPAIAVLGIVVLGAIVFFIWRGSGGDPGSTEPSAPEAAAGQSQPAPAAAPAAQPQAPPFAELSTVRRAWVRVVVDGRKVIEGELPADSHVPIGPGSQIVVRAGDAGAVRVAIGGKDQGVVGADGQVATKTYTVAVRGGVR